MLILKLMIQILNSISIELSNKIKTSLEILNNHSQIKIRFFDSKIT